MSTTVVVGSYTRKEDHVDGKGKGIYTISMDHTSGKMELIHVNENTGINPSFLATSGNTVVAVNECADVLSDHPHGTGYVSSYILESNGKLIKKQELPTHGTYPCHVVFDPTNRFVSVANYGGGNIALYPIENSIVHAPKSIVQMNGASFVNPQRQEAPHCHSTAWITPSILAVLDLGSDRVMQYSFNSQTGTLQPHANPFVAMPPGAGPRHLDVHPTKPVAYIVHELTNSLSVHSIDASNGLSPPLQIVSLLPRDDPNEGSLAAEVRVSKCGHFVICSTRGHDQLVVFRITYPSGHLGSPQFVSCLGKVPRHFQLVSTDLVIVANQNSHDLVSYRLSPEKGLVATGEVLSIPSPVCLAIV